MWVETSPSETILARNTPQKVKAVDLRKYLEARKEIKTFSLGNTK